MPSGVRYGEGCPLFSRLRGLGWGSVVSSPSGVRGRVPTENGFWRVLKATERSFLYLYDKICGGTICIIAPTPNSGGTCPPCSPVIYAHAGNTCQCNTFYAELQIYSRLIIYDALIRFIFLAVDPARTKPFPANRRGQRDKKWAWSMVV